MVRGSHGFTAETALIGEDAKALIFEGNAVVCCSLRACRYQIGKLYLALLAAAEPAIAHRRLRPGRCGLVGGAWKARVMNGTNSLMTSSVLAGLQRPLENAEIRCGPAAV
jgi:hypothetical protein